MGHSCSIDVFPMEEVLGFNVAIYACYEDANGYLWVGNGEAGNVVDFCPFCGYEAKVKMGAVRKKPKPSTHKLIIRPLAEAP
jgi:hypothetical protein